LESTAASLRGSPSPRLRTGPSSRKTIVASDVPHLS
jgi:hypothetical protein